MKTMITNKLAKTMKNAKNAVNRLFQDNRGDGYVDVLMKILIAVVVGAALMAVMKVAMPALFEEMLAKIRSLLVI